MAGLFLIGYGVFRFLVEYVRDIDPNVNTVDDLITRGQLLSLPMIIGGLAIIIWAYSRKKHNDKRLNLVEILQISNEIQPLFYRLNFAIVIENTQNCD
ncbi:prolipoprotein diacylglyceryl transferase [Actinobacillus equuli]|nr:prolipoprotein diacylglyceryl transferase [Actinobacillus equuli]